MRHNGLWAVDERFVTTIAQHDRANARDDERHVFGVLGGQSLSPDDFTFAQLVGDTAVVPVRGILMHRFSWWAWSYEEIARDIELAVADDRADRIVLDIDSPGGLVAGIEIAVAAIERAKEIKPVLALVNGAAGALSAAFWIASAASKVFATPSAYSGSVGAVIEYLDLEPMWIAAGARKVEVVAEVSPNKRLDPESPEGKAELQALVDASGNRFVADLARLKGRSEAEILSQFGQGLVLPPSAALERGMIDEIAPAEDVIGGRVTDGPDTVQTQGPDPVAVPEHEEVAMRSNPGSGATEPKLTLEALKRDHPELASALIDEGKSAAATEAETKASAEIQAERARVAALDGLLAKVGGSEDAAKIIAEAKADGSTAEATALKLFESGATQKAAVLGAIASDDATATAAKPAAAGAGDGGGDPSAKSDDALKADWQGSDKLKADFPSAEAYISFTRANASGRVRLKTGATA